jgi:orotate phosphoribosyltransferase
VNVPARERLLDLLAKDAYQYDPSAPFTLASGGQSAEYIDCKNALSHPEAMAAVGALLHPMLDRRVRAIGGLTMGADPIAHAVSQHSAGTVDKVRWFTVRKEAKKHGRLREIEGGVPPGTEVVVVDDVATQGTSTIDAIRKCLLAGYGVLQVIVLVDRQQGGLERIRSEVPPTVPVTAIFTKAEIHARWERIQGAKREAAPSH